MQLILILKAVHVIGFVSWFAGLFYLVRLFVNHAEVLEENGAGRPVLAPYLSGMEWRVYRIILNPAMMITWLAGLGMLAMGLFSDRVPNYLDMGTPGWMHLKLVLLLLLTGYHLWCKRIIPQLEGGNSPYSPWQFRMMNELPTLFLAAIAFTATLGKVGQLNYWYLLFGIVLFAALIYRGAVAYRQRRQKQDQKN